MTAGELVQAPGVGVARMAGERGSEGDDETDELRRELGEFARVEPAEAPPDQANLAPIRGIEFAQLVVGAVHHPFAKAETRKDARPEIRASGLRLTQDAQRLFV